MSITQNLSTLRLAYTRLLEERGADVALLRQRELELQDAERDAAEARVTIARLQEDRDAIRDKASRQEHQVELAEREVKFLKAMVVSGVGTSGCRKTTTDARMCSFV